MLDAKAESDLMDQQDLEAHAEGDDEHEEDDAELEQGLEDVEEHDDVDAEIGELPDVAEEVEPGQGDHWRSQLPLAALKNVYLKKKDFETFGTGSTGLLI